MGKIFASRQIEGGLVLEQKTIFLHQEMLVKKSSLVMTSSRRHRYPKTLSSELRSVVPSFTFVHQVVSKELKQTDTHEDKITL